MTETQPPEQNDPQQPPQQNDPQQPPQQNDPRQPTEQYRQQPPQQHGQQPPQQFYQQQYGQQPPHQPPQQFYQQPAPSKKGGLAIAALIVGIAAFFVGLVPVLGIIMGLSGIGLGIWALVAKQSKGMSIIGITLASLALITSGVTTAALVGSTGQVSEALKDVTEEPPAEPETEADEKPEATKDEKPEATKDEKEKPGAPVEWTTVGTLSGNADQQSDTIALTGNKVRLTYEFTSAEAGGLDMIVGAIYVLKEGTDLMEDGGIPEVMVTEAGTGDTILRKKAGEYFISVSAANASYTVTLEEQK